MTFQKIFFLVFAFSFLLFSCKKEEGCTDITACNFSLTAEEDDGSCISPGDECDDNNSNTNNDTMDSNCVCQGTGGSAPGSGCTDSNACNYDSSAEEDDGSCLFTGDPCNDFNSNTINDTINLNCDCVGTTSESGCMDSNACNYDANANVSNPSSCEYPGDPCNDGDPDTSDDQLDNNCDCVGTPPQNDQCAIDNEGWILVTFGLYADSWEDECQYRIHATTNESITTDWMYPTVENSTNEVQGNFSVGDWTMNVEDEYGDGKGANGYYYATCVSTTGSEISLVNTPFTDGFSSSTNFTLGTGFTDQSLDDNN